MNEKMVTLQEVEKVWGNANFGPKLNNNKLDLIKYALLKCASGYHEGSTSNAITKELKLIDHNYRRTIVSSSHTACRHV